MSKKIVIAGAGIGGLCAALALAKHGFDVAIYEQSSHLGEVGAGLQLSPNAIHVLQALGIADKVKAKAFRPKSAVMRHYQTGKTYFTVPLADTATQKYGADYLHVHRADLHRTLLDACQSMEVSIHLGQAVESYQHDFQNLTIHLANGESLKAGVLIGADGIKSKVQACMLGQTSAEFTGQVAWRGVVEVKKLPYELIKPNANLWVGPGKHFVSYYLRGGDLVNFVAVQERTDWQKESWNEPGDINELRQTFDGWHPEVTKLLAATESCFLWALFDRQPLNQWTDSNVALLGDACHPMLPFLAQGAAMAIEDSYALAHCLASDTDTHTALQTYQNIRLPRSRDIQLNARKNAALYHMSSPIEEAKLAVLSGLSKLGLSDRVAVNKLDSIYAYNIVKQLN
ncbi:FAD-dependent monooxygenase [Paraglaciecola psychrophila]|uniref:Monooxygenase, FAD-binding protein n=1 Tax=Paraglaciecola psychrophila 170 TaxID=1129794 RepID=K6Z4W7_9ALTE|nr:FAD-dependent monooxygenase [Paraglaciecola psychrophila]AGH42925.1 monooxygenase, FAD-binding protein [Paraglaciecola psychrophila 170]GAC40124.1 3-hydroxybenzoate 6-hydroxylase [Paraglaciecola psychrophila 170]